MWNFSLSFQCELIIFISLHFCLFTKFWTFPFMSHEGDGSGVWGLGLVCISCFVVLTEMGHSAYEYFYFRNAGLFLLVFLHCGISSPPLHSKNIWLKQFHLNCLNMWNWINEHMRWTNQTCPHTRLSNSLTRLSPRMSSSFDSCCLILYPL